MPPVANTRDAGRRGPAPPTPTPWWRRTPSAGRRRPRGRARPPCGPGPGSARARRRRGRPGHAVEHRGHRRHRPDRRAPPRCTGRAPRRWPGDGRPRLEKIVDSRATTGRPSARASATSGADEGSAPGQLGARPGFARSRVTISTWACGERIEHDRARARSRPRASGGVAGRRRGVARDEHEPFAPGRAATRRLGWPQPRQGRIGDDDRGPGRRPSSTAPSTTAACDPARLPGRRRTNSATARSSSVRRHRRARWRTARPA